MTKKTAQSKENPLGTLEIIERDEELGIVAILRLTEHNVAKTVITDPTGELSITWDDSSNLSIHLDGEDFVGSWLITSLQSTPSRIMKRLVCDDGKSAMFDAGHTLDDEINLVLESGTYRIQLEN